VNVRVGITWFDAAIPEPQELKIIAKESTLLKRNIHKKTRIDMIVNPTQWLSNQCTLPVSACSMHNAIDFTKTPAHNVP
jgi:hypothetical protein